MVHQLPLQGFVRDASGSAALESVVGHSDGSRGMRTKLSAIIPRDSEGDARGRESCMGFAKTAQELLSWFPLPPSTTLGRADSIDLNLRPQTLSGDRNATTRLGRRRDMRSRYLATSDLILQSLHLDPRFVRACVVDSMDCLHEISCISFEDVFHVFLWVSIDEWEPTALHVNHNPMPFLERMEYVLQRNRYRRNLTADKGLGNCVTLSKSSAKNFASNHLLVST